MLRTITTRALGTAVASRVGEGMKNAERALSTAPPHNKDAEGGKIWSGNLSFATPESDFSSEAARDRDSIIDLTHKSEDHRSSMAHSISFATPESDFSSPHIYSLLDDRQRRQLAESENKWKSHGEVVAYDTRRELLDDHAVHTDHAVHDQAEAEPQFHFEEVFARTDSRPLPQTLAEATLNDDDRAIVVTESTVPFKIVSVNAAWEGLCGYTAQEARGKTLGDLLQGPETDTGAATALIDKLLHGMEAGAVLTNYAKDGRKFQNRIRVGTLVSHDDRVTHFVGVLREITEMGEHFGDVQRKEMQTA